VEAGAISLSSMGEVVAIFVGPERQLSEPVERVAAYAGKGLVGNRYYWPDGSAPDGNALTLIEEEALEAFRSESGIELTAQASRRNVLTRGIDLNALIGRRFVVGGVECLGQRRCQPCAHLQRITGRPRILRALVHRGGLRADVVSGGEIAIGDEIAAV
jgi:MOSC domain-containing protein YiiM